LNKQRNRIATSLWIMPSCKQAQAQVAESQASLKQLEEQLSYTTIVSSIDGVVLSRDVEVGDAVSSILVLGSTATLVFTLGDTSQVYVDGKVTKRTSEVSIWDSLLGSASNPSKIAFSTAK